MIDSKTLLKIKQDYAKGMRLRLIKMGCDPYPVPDGTKGTVDFVDDAGQIHMRWDNGSSLALIVGEDEFEVLHPMKVTARYANGAVIEETFDTKKEAVVFASKLIIMNTGDAPNIRYSYVTAQGGEIPC